PFQPDMGSHTSILISESLDGVSVAATRQNAGKPANAAGLPPRATAPGGANAPGATSVAMVTFVFARFSVVTLSHDAADACDTGQRQMRAITDRKEVVRRICLMTPLENRLKCGTGWRNGQPGIRGSGFDA